MIRLVDYSPEKAGVGGSTPSRGTMISTIYKLPSTQFHSISFQNNFGPPRFVPTGMAVGVERLLGLLAINKDVRSSRGPPKPRKHESFERSQKWDLQNHQNLPVGPTRSLEEEIR